MRESTQPPVVCRYGIITGLTMKRLSHLIVFIIAVAGVCGCTKSSRDAFESTDPVELSARFEETIPTGKVMKVSEMASNDVIVAVNGYPLTRGEYDWWMALRYKYLLQKSGNNQIVAEKMYDRAQHTFIREFIMQRLMVDAAKKMGVSTAEEITAKLDAMIDASAQKAGKTRKEYLANFPQDGKFHKYQTAVKLWINELVKQKIPPVFDVTSNYVAAVQEQVAEDNKYVMISNNMAKARLEKWREDIINGKEEFEKLADKYSQDSEKHEHTEGGYWGEFVRGGMDDMDLQADVFNLQEGGLSKVYEDDEGYRLVKVLEIKPPQYNDKGRLIREEARVLAQIFLEKGELFVRLSDADLEKDLKHQMQMRAIDDFIGNLHTNGENRIEYPPGNALFD